ncbi:MAG: hypothetical protein WA864_03195 [Acetobacteraceae bacterium]
MEAAGACQSATFRNADHQVDFLRRLAFSVATEFGRLVTLEVIGRDVVVTFVESTGPEAA